MSLLGYLVQYRFRHMGELMRNGKKPPLTTSRDLKGKLVVITGTTAGIGLETARLFSAQGASLICINRNPEKAAAVEAELKGLYGNPIESLTADFSSLEDVHRCAQTLLRGKEPMDVLIHNSGVFNTKLEFSRDNIEMVFQVNHLAAFLLTYLLRDKLKKENRCRIINVNSEGHRFALSGVHLEDLDWRRHRYGGFKSYGAAKTAQLLCMNKFAEYFAGSGVTINSMHPGNVRSDMGNNNGDLYKYLKRKLILSSALEPEISAQALHYLAAAEELQGISGKFYHLTSEETPAPHARDLSQVEPVWKKSLELCGLE